MEHLVVVRPFGPYRVGEVVTDAASIEHLLTSEHAEHVVKIIPPKEG